MSMIFGILFGLVLGWLGHHYWLNYKIAVRPGGTEKPQGGGGHGEE